jgi:hypothetical protein
MLDDPDRKRTQQRRNSFENDSSEEEREELTSGTIRIMIRIC